MRGVCSVVLDSDRALISFGGLKKSYLNFLQEIEVPLSSSNGNLLSCLRENLDILDQKIKEVEKSFPFRFEKIFLELPWGFASKRKVADIIPLKRRKRISPGDIAFARKYLEDKFLDWDDFCIHHITTNYEVEGATYEKVPLGLRAKKIKLESQLFWIKDKVRREIEDIFDNLDREFGGLIDPGISMFSSSFRRKEKIQAVLSVNYSNSCFVVRKKEGFIFSKDFDFSLKKMVEQLGRNFGLTPPLAEEVFNRYISFKELPYFKEITIKREGGYLNLSTQTLNSFIKDYIKQELTYLLEQIKEVSQAEFIISFIGRLSVKEGFYGFLQSCTPYSLQAPIQKSSLSSSFGCLRYGVSPFLDSDYKSNGFFLRSILNIYKEYF